LFLIGDTCIELFSPRGPGSLLGQNLRRYGDSFHSLEWKVNDLERAKAALTERGVRIPTEVPGSFFMTHPADCHGLLLEICGHDMANDPRLDVDWSDDAWRNGPIGLLSLNAVSAAVRDLDACVAFVTAVTGAEVDSLRTVRGLGRVARLVVGGHTLELVEPTEPASAVGHYINRYGPRVRALNFAVRNLESAKAHFESNGLRLMDGDGEGWFAIDPSDNYGALYQFSDSAPEKGWP